MNKWPYSCLLLGVIAVLICCSPQAAPSTDLWQPALTADTPAAADDGGKALFDKSCTSCHKAVRIEKYKGSDTWKTVVSRMIKKNGAKIAENDTAQIVTYLDKTYPKK